MSFRSSVRLSNGLSRRRTTERITAHTPEVFTLTLIGVPVGIPTALALVRLMSSQLYAAEQTHYLDIFFAAIATVVFFAALAGPIPAYRASIVDAKQALRYE